VSCGDQSGHVEAVADETAPAIDCAFATHSAAVAIKRCYSDQCSNFTSIELSKLWHLSQEQFVKRVNHFDNELARR